MELTDVLFRQGHERDIGYDDETFVFVLGRHGLATVLNQEYGRSLMPDLCWISLRMPAIAYTSRQESKENFSNVCQTTNRSRLGRFILGDYMSWTFRSSVFQIHPSSHLASDPLVEK